MDSRFGVMPTSEDLIGKHRVTVLSGALPNMSWLGNVKIIKKKKGKLVGYNRTLGFRWGRFDIHEGFGHVIFAYRNKKFYDSVWETGNGKLEGEYKVIVPEVCPPVVGEFTMGKIE